MLQEQNTNILTEVLAQLKRIGVASTEPNASPTAFPTSDRPQNDGTLARRLLRALQQRPRSPSGRKLPEGSWNMLLELTASHQEDRPLSITSLTAASGEPPTTALRHLDELEAEGLIERERDPRDRRRTFMIASPLALSMASSIIRQLRRALW